MGVCDVPIISTVCDVAGEAAATVVAAPFDWLANAIGGAAGWLIEGHVERVRHDHPGLTSRPPDSLRSTT